MAFGRPHRPNDPSVVSSLEAAVREIRRPGPLELLWNWRWELGILIAGAGLSALVAGSFGLIGLAATAWAGLAIGCGSAACWGNSRAIDHDPCFACASWCASNDW